MNTGRADGRRRRSLLIIFGFALVTAAVIQGGPAQAATTSATASVSPGTATRGATSTFTFTINNTGSGPIAGVEITSPSRWDVLSCPHGPSNWTIRPSSTQCRYYAAVTAASPLSVGSSSSAFKVTARTTTGSADRVGKWVVKVSPSKRLDPLSTASASSTGALTTTSHVFEVLSAVVTSSSATPGSACPPAVSSGPRGATRTIIVCGRNRAGTTLTPVAGFSSLGGTFLQSPGTFSSAAIAPGTTSVVLGNWSGAQITNNQGTGKTVIAMIGSRIDRTSALTTLAGYEAIGEPPVAVVNSASTNEDTATGPITLQASDGDGDATTFSIGTAPAHGTLGTISTPSSCVGTLPKTCTATVVYTPTANYAGADSFKYVANDGFGDSAPVVVSLTVNSVNDRPAGTDGSVTTLEDTTKTLTAADFGFTDPNDSPPNALHSIEITNTPAAGTLTHDGSAITLPYFVTAADLAANKLAFVPAANANGSPYTSFTFQVADDGGTTNGGANVDATPNTLTINVTPVNDPPSFTGGNDRTVLEDAGLQTVNNWASVIDDGPGESGQTLTFVATNDNNALFSAQPAVSPGGHLTFTPAANQHGSATVSVVLKDNGGTAGGGDDDSATDMFTITVTSVNDAPAGTNGSVTSLEDTAYPFTAADFGFTDPSDTPANNLFAVRITTVPGAGTLTKSGSPVSAGVIVSVADITAGNLAFTPAANGKGTPYTSFTFQVQDDGGFANFGADLDPTANTLTVNVTSVNDGPAGTNGSVGTLEDTPVALTAAAFGFTDPNDSPPDGLGGVVITTLPGSGTLANNSVAVAANDLVTATELAANKLVFTPASNASGAPYATLTFQVRDDGGTANGGVNTDATANTLTLNVTAVNDAPAGTNGSVITLEDTAETLTAADFGFTDPNDSPANAFAGVVITTLPGAGTLANNSVAVVAGGFVTAADVAANKLVFTPAANGNGTPYTSFTFQVQDDGGTANSGSDTDPTANTFTVNVTSVNDAPAGTNGSVITIEDTAIALAAGDFGFTDPDDNPDDGFAGVVITTLPANGTLTTSSVPTAAGDFVAAADLAGNLVFTPATNGEGSPYTTFTFQVRDDGGTANSGSDSDSTANTLTINVTPVNDAPTAVGDTYPVPPGGLTVAAPGVLGNDTDPDAGDTKTAILVAGPAHAAGAGGTFTLNNNGSFNYTPETTFTTGTDSFTYKVKDVGNLESAPATVSLPLNQPPTADNDGPYITNEDTLLSVNAANGVLNGDADPDTAPNPALTAVLVSGPSHAAVSGFTLNSDGSFGYTPALNYNGPDSFTYKANDGASDSNVATVSITVNPVNDAPTATNLNGAETYTEDTTLNLTDIVASDVDSANVTATLTLSNTAAGSLTTATSGTTTSTYTVGTGVWTASGPIAEVNTLLAGVSFSPAANVNANFTIATSVSDGALSATGSKAVTGTPVNDPPTASNLNAAETYTEDTPLNLTDIVAADVDSANVTATLTLSSTTVGTLTTATSGTTTSTYTVGTGVWSASGPIAEVNTLLAGVSFSPAANVNANFTIATSVSDGALSVTGSKAVTGTPVNDAPSITLSGSTPSFTEDGSPVTVDGGLTVADVDSANLASGSVTVSAGLHSGDTLSFTTAGGISDTNALPEVLTLTGSTTVANWQSALQSVQFSTTNQDPGTSRTIRFTVSDGTASSTPADKAVTVVPVNDPPVLNLDAPGTLTFTENGSATNLFGPAASVTDVDNATLASLKVTIGTGFDAAFDTLDLNTAGFTTNFTGGVLTITKAGGTPADFTTALRNVRFRNTSDDPDHRNDGTPNPSDADRTVSAVANDGTDNSVSQSRNLTITPVNDPPSVPTALPTTTDVRNTTLVAGTNSVTGPKVTRTVDFKSNSIDPDGLESNITVVPASSAATVQSGRITLDASGNLVYEPPASASLASDTYGYQLTDGSTPSSSITFTVNLSGAVWYVADSAPAPRDGTAARPFDTVAGALGVASTNQAIHIRRAPGDGVLTAGVTLQSGQKLIGEGVALTNTDVGSATAETLFAAGTKPELTSSNVDTVTVAANAQIAGLTLNPDGTANAVSNGVSAAGVTLRDMAVNDTGTNATQPGIELTGTGNGLTFSGTDTLSTTAAGALSVTNTALSGTIASTTVTAGTASPGVSLNATTGSLTFTTVAITTSSQTGFLLVNADAIDVGSGSVATTNRPAVDATQLDTGSDLTFTDVDSTNSTTTGVNLAGANTNWTFSTGSGSTISGATGDSFAVNGGSGNITYPGSISNSATGTLSVNIQNKNGGTVPFSGALNSSGFPGKGVSLTGNTGTTMSFTGGVFVSSGATNGFVATGGGTVSVTGSTNTLATTTGTALNVNGTTIGASGMNFKSISSNGATNGIVLNGTGAGILTVTGDGSQTGGLFDRDGSGGTIQSTSQDAVLLTNAHATLRQLNVTNAGWDGVQATGSGNVTLSAVDINHPGNANPAANGATGNPSGFGGGNGFYVENGSGTYSFDNNSRVINWQSSQSNAVLLHNTGTNFTSLTVDHALISTSATAAAGIHANLNGATSGQVGITNSEFTLIDQNGAQILNNGSGTIRAIVQGNNFHDADATSGDGNNTLYLANSANGHLNYTIGGGGALGNTFHNLARLTTLAGVIQVDAAGGDSGTPSGGVINGAITNNNIWNDSGFVNGRRAIDIQVEADSHNLGQLVGAITNNTVNNVQGNAIHVSVVSVGGGSVTDANWTITGNNLGTPGTNNGIRVGLDNTDSSSAIEFETNVDVIASSNAQLANKLQVSNNTAVNSANNATGGTLDITNIGSSGASGSATLDATITNNTLTNVDTAGTGHVLDVLNSSASSHETLNLNITGNNTTLGGSTAGEIRLRQLAGTYNIVGGVAAVSGNNSGDTVATTGSFGTVASVTTPTAPSF
ncbi:MAG: trimeric autotransporter adhesin [Actinomycetota bacterium]|jgi:hypothetical protein